MFRGVCVRAARGESKRWKSEETRGERVVSVDVVETGAGAEAGKEDGA